MKDILIICGVFLLFSLIILGPAAVILIRMRRQKNSPPGFNPSEALSQSEEKKAQATGYSRTPIKQHDLPVSDDELTPSSGEEPANDRPGDTPISQTGITLRPFALQTSLLVTLLFVVGSVVSLVSMFSGTDFASKALGVLLLGFLAWLSIRLLWDYYRSKDIGKRYEALKLLNIWGFMWIGLGLGSLALGAGFALLIPIFKNLSMATLSYKAGSVIGVIVVGGWIYWAVSTIFKK